MALDNSRVMVNLSIARDEADKLSLENQQLLRQLSGRQRKHLSGQSVPRTGIVIPKDGFMKTRQYQSLLKNAGLLELQPGAPDEGQHVFHIIAAANGGPDHVDNFLFALGGTFNMSIGDHLDNVNCFLAGKAKSRKAVMIAMKVANDPSLHSHIDKRRKSTPALYTESCHRYKDADELFAEGQALMKAITVGARANRR